MSKCPCINCICVPMCMNMKILPVLKKCVLIYAHLVRRENSKGTTLDMDRLMEYCSIMHIEINHSGRTFQLEYIWEALL
jgi:hypothetical protein